MRYEAEARALVASWPEPTEQSNRELTTLALRHKAGRTVLLAA